MFQSETAVKQIPWPPTGRTGGGRTLRGLALLDPGGEGLLEVLVLLERDGGANLGREHHLGAGGHLTRQRAHHDLGGAGRRGRGARQGGHCHRAGLWI